MRLPFLELSGTCREQGQVHGETLKDLIEKNIQIYFERFEKEAKLIRSEVLERAESCLDSLQKQSLNYCEGIGGISEGSNQGILEIAMLNFRYELLYHAIGKLQIDAVDGCTSYALLPGASVYAHTIMARTGTGFRMWNVPLLPPFLRKVLITWLLQRQEFLGERLG